MRLTSFARRTAAVTAVTALISSGGAVLAAAPALAAPAQVDHTSPTQADNRSSAVTVTAYATPGNFLPGDVLVLHPDSVLPWVVAGGTDATHEVTDITSGSSTIATDQSSESASFNLVMAPPGRYQVLVKHLDNSVSTPTSSTVLTIFDYGDANVTSVAAGRDSTGSRCNVPPGACDRGDNALDITGSNFARGAVVQFLKPDLSPEPATAMAFTPGNPGNTNGTGYPSTTLIQGDYAANQDTSGLPLFTPGKHFLRVVNTYPSTSATGAKTKGTTVEFWQPWFSTTDVTTNVGSGNAAVIGAGASNVTLRIKGRGFRPGSTVAVQGGSYAPGTTCGDITVGTTTVTALTPTTTDPSDSLLTAVLSAAPCTDTTTTPLRRVTILGPDGATWTRDGALAVRAAPKVDAKSFATLGQGANHFPGAGPFDFEVTGSGFDTATTPSPSVCPRFDFGAGTTTTTTSCGSATSAMVQVDVDPTATVGTYGVTVTNPSDGGSSTTAANSQAVPPYAPLTVAVGPSITSVTPTSFSPGDTKTVTVTGKDFKAGLSVSARRADPVTHDLSQAYPGVTIGTVTLNQTGQLKVPPTTEATATFIVSVAPNAPIGQITLVLGNTDHGTAVCTCIGVDSLAVSPPSDGNTGTSVLGFTGIPLNSGASHLGDLVGAHSSVALTPSVATDPPSAQPPIVGTLLTKTGSDSATASFDLKDAAPGQYSVTWVADTTANPQVVWTCSACFTVNGSAISNVAIAPSSAGVGAQGRNVTITGSNFSHGMTVAIDGNVQVGSVTFHPASGATASYLTAVVNVPSDVTPGQYDVTVAPADGKSPAVLTKGFTVTPPPTVTGIGPAAYGQGAKAKADGTALTVTVSGTDFGTTGHALLDLGPGITLTDQTVTKCPTVPLAGGCQPNTSDLLVAKVVVAPDAATGARDVVVRNDDGGVGTKVGAFTVDPGPKVLSVADENGTPALRPDGQQHTITIVGSGFSTDTTNKPVVAVAPGDKVTLGTVTVVSASQLTVPVTVAADAVRGARGISVTNPGDRGYGECAASPHPCAYVAVEPGAPASLTLTSGARSLIASWPAPASDGGAPITSYRIAYTPQGTTSPTTVDVPASPRTYTIGGLTNGVTYVVSVAAVNGVGKSAPRSATGVAGIAAAVSLRGSATRVVWGSRLYFTGTLRGVGGAALPSRNVVLYFFPSTGSVKYYTRTVRTNSTGAFGYVVDWRYDSPYNGKVRAYFLGDSTTYRLSSSAYVGYAVATRVLKTAPASFSKSSASTVLKISGTVTPNKRGAAIYLYRVVSGGLQAYAKTYVTSTSTYTFAIRPGRGTYTFLVYIPNTVGNVAGRSATFTLYRV